MFTKRLKKWRSRRTLFRRLRKVNKFKHLKHRKKFYKALKRRIKKQWLLLNKYKYVNTKRFQRLRRSKTLS